MMPSIKKTAKVKGDYNLKEFKPGIEIIKQKFKQNNLKKTPKEKEFLLLQEESKRI